MTSILVFKYFGFIQVFRFKIISSLKYIYIIINYFVNKNKINLILNMIIYSY